ncbi:type IV pilus modification protein PilV [Variovorax boronicumulans]|uniref:type IV pilus modification protein PilV n=1 Tax=Variovorax boronicumulans TaxID=436515 RepID=UPI003393C98B
MASTKHSAAGFSLVEVLVSIVVLSVGLLGTLGMLLASVRTGNETATFTAALNLARELSEKARINKGLAAKNNAANAYLVEDWRAGSASGASAAVKACVATVARCTPEDLAAWDMREWTHRVAKALPDARLSVCFDDAPWNATAGEYAWACSHTGNTVVVKLGWTPRTGGEEGRSSMPPRLVMQLVAGQVHDGQAGS